MRGLRSTTAVRLSKQPEQPVAQRTSATGVAEVTRGSRRFPFLRRPSLRFATLTLVCILIMLAAVDVLWFVATSISVFFLSLSIALLASCVLLLTRPVGRFLRWSWSKLCATLPLPTPRRWARTLGRYLFQLAKVTPLTLCLLAAGVSFTLSGVGNFVIAPTLPQTTGALRLSGLDHPVTVLRDRYGVPHLYASDSHDLAEAQGFVTASDRYFQMDGAWRVAAGHLAEAYGAGPGNSYLQTDVFMRSLGFDRASQQEYAQMDPTTRAEFDAYTTGVNAYLAQHQHHPPLEYTVSSLQAPFAPAEWTSIKSLDIMRYFAFSFSDWYIKLVAGAVNEQGGQSLSAALYPATPITNPIVMNAATPASSSPASAASVPSLHLVGGTAKSLTQAAVHLGTIATTLGLASGHLGSNNWALDTTQTATGGAIEVGDPHVPTILPAIWYQIGLTAPGESAIGAGVPGMPGILIGHNARLAFSMTISDLSDADVYVIQTTGCPTGSYRYDGHCLPFITRREGVQVAGSQTISVTIFSTQTGVVVLPNQAPVTSTGTAALPQLSPTSVLGLRTTLDNPTFAPSHVVGLATATTWSAFLASTNNVPLGLNWLVALQSGAIGYRMSGVMPIRPAANVGLPADGSVSTTAWQGYVSQEKMPRIAPGNAHQLVSANNTIQRAPIQGMPIGVYPDQGYRAQRITDLLAQLPAGTATSADMERIQSDVYSIPGSLMTPTFVAVGQRAGAAARQAAQLLSGWNDTMTTSSSAAAVCELTLANLVRLVVAPKLGATLYGEYVNSSPDEGSGLTAVAIAIVQHPDKYFSGNEEAVKAARDEAIIQAEQQAIATLAAHFGADSSQWHWGGLHQLVLSEPGFGDQAFVGSAFSVSPSARPGDETTIDMGGNYNQYLPTPDWSQTYGPAYRQVIDMAHPDNSGWILAPGESGQPFSPHFADQLPRWNQGDLTTMVTTQATLAHDPNTQTLQLVPVV